MKGKEHKVDNREAINDEKERNIRRITEKLDLGALSQYSRFNIIIRTPGDHVTYC